MSVKGERKKREKRGFNGESSIEYVMKENRYLSFFLSSLLFPFRPLFLPSLLPTLPFFFLTSSSGKEKKEKEREKKEETRIERRNKKEKKKEEWKRSEPCLEFGSNILFTP